MNLNILSKVPELVKVIGFTGLMVLGLGYSNWYFINKQFDYFQVEFTRMNQKLERYETTNFNTLLEVAKNYNQAVERNNMLLDNSDNGQLSKHIEKLESTTARLYQAMLENQTATRDQIEANRALIRMLYSFREYNIRLKQNDKIDTLNTNQK